MTNLQTLLSTAKKLEAALAKFGKDSSAPHTIGSKEMMRVAMKEGVYPFEPKWRMLKANWDDGKPVRKLIILLDQNHFDPKHHISCEFIKSINKDIEKTA